MLRAAARGLPASRPEPDRRGAIRGLSLTGFHRVAYVDWGPLVSPNPVVCVHGLTRQGRDFDYLAARLAAAGRRTVCPDLAGRGRSGRLSNPEQYALPQYCADINALIAHLGVDSIDWVGTSLGGLIGMVLASFAGTPIRRLVVNDIGPYLPWAGLARIGQYISEMPAGFRNLDDAEAYMRTVLAPFGSLANEHWLHITRHSVEWQPAQERYVMLCDPGIARAFRNPWQYSLDLWQYWEAIEVPILVLRGTRSDLLPADLAAKMGQRNKRARIHEFEGVGHAPPLMTPDQIDVVASFLSE
jgi:pimeloyl-ACP methyl ester carboxylesterase